MPTFYKLKDTVRHVTGYVCQNTLSRIWVSWHKSRQAQVSPKRRMAAGRGGAGL